MSLLSQPLHVNQRIQTLSGPCSGQNMKQKDQGQALWAQSTHPSLQDILTGHSLCQISFLFSDFQGFFGLNIYNSVDKHIVE